jgi:hypothetical protein
MGAVEPIFALLALCARAQAHPVQAAPLREQGTAFQEWDALPAPTRVRLTSLNTATPLRRI